MTTLLGTSIAVSLLAIVAICLTGLMRRGSAAMRHWVLAVAIVCALAVPLFQTIAPSWRLPAAPAPAVTEQVAYRVAAANAAPLGFTESARVSPAVPVANLLLPAWIVGVAISLSLLVIAIMRLAWIGSRAARITDGRWTAILDAVSREHGMRRPVQLLQSTHPTLLVTWGSVRPKVLLPAVARDWPDDRIRVVLSHELAHIVRRDWATQILAEVLRSVYWFNPLVWITCRRLRRESEHACDDAVLNMGVDGAEYATHLLDLARMLRSHNHLWSPAPAMARPSTLERRIRAMLNHRHNRLGLTRSMRLGTSIALLAMTLVIAGFTASAQTFSTLSGSIVDSQRAALADARLVLSNIESKAKYEVRSNRSGQFEFVGVTSGDYVLQAIVPGFKTFQTNVTLAGQTLRRDIGMNVGTLEETIKVSGGGRVRSAEEIVKEERLGLAARAGFQRALAECRPSDSVAGGAVGGQIRPPRKVRDVRPLYPEGARSAGIGGIVKLVAVIGTDGLIKEVKSVDATVNPDLVEAATEAVRQWEFDGTLLNCIPVEVEMTVSVGFDPAR